jgi:hypothetical protein
MRLRRNTPFPSGPIMPLLGICRSCESRNKRSVRKRLGCCCERERNQAEHRKDSPHDVGVLPDIT